MKGHFRVLSEDTEVGTAVFGCPECNSVFCQESDYMRHMASGTCQRQAQFQGRPKNSSSASSQLPPYLEGDPLLVKNSGMEEEGDIIVLSDAYGDDIDADTNSAEDGKEDVLYHNADVSQLDCDLYVKNDLELTIEREREFSSPLEMNSPSDVDQNIALQSAYPFYVYMNTNSDPLFLHDV